MCCELEPWWHMREKDIATLQLTRLYLIAFKTETCQSYWPDNIRADLHQNIIIKPHSLKEEKYVPHRQHKVGLVLNIRLEIRLQVSTLFVWKILRFCKLFNKKLFPFWVWGLSQTQFTFIYLWVNQVACLYLLSEGELSNYHSQKFPKHRIKLRFCFENRFHCCDTMDLLQAPRPLAHLTEYWFKERSVGYWPPAQWKGNLQVDSG